MPSCRHFSFTFLKFHALLGFIDTESVTKRYHGTVRNTDPVFSTV